jgi:aminoglycoside phosphotransferase (APT) family kinase protein
LSGDTSVKRTRDGGGSDDCIPAHSAVDLPVDLRPLLASLCGTLQKCSSSNPELAGALQLIQRWRTQMTAQSGAGLSYSDIRTELALMQRRTAALAAMKRADQRRIDEAHLWQQDEAMLQTLLQEKVYGGRGGRVQNVNMAAGGYSKQTVFFDWRCNNGDCHSYVLRKDAPFSFFGTSVSNEFPIVEALFRAGVPVAEPILLQTNSPSTPQAFMVSRRMKGQSFGGPTTGFKGLFSHDPTPCLAQVLARIHTLSIHNLGLGYLRRGTTDCDVVLFELDVRWKQYLSFREIGSAILDSSFEWLRRNAEIGAQPAVLTHGDCNLYNFLFDGIQFVALLDWELAGVLSPAWDLAFARESVETFGSFERFLELYQQAGGPRVSKKALAYYEVYRLVRGVVGSVTCVSLFNRGAPLSLELVEMCSCVYSAYAAQIPDAIRACELTVD